MPITSPSSGQLVETKNQALLSKDSVAKSPQVPWEQDWTWKLGFLSAYNVMEGQTGQKDKHDVRLS